MVAIEVPREVATYTQDGQTYRVSFNPDDVQGSIEKLVSLAERKELSWPIVAALRIAIVNKAYPTVIKTTKKHAKRLG